MAYFADSALNQWNDNGGGDSIISTTWPRSMLELHIISKVCDPNMPLCSIYNHDFTMLPWNECGISLTVCCRREKCRSIEWCVCFIVSFIASFCHCLLARRERYAGTTTAGIIDTFIRDYFANMSYRPPQNLYDYAERRPSVWLICIQSSTSSCHFNE